MHGYYIAIIFLAFAGFLISFYLYHEKRKHRRPVCPLGGHCDVVIHSAWSKFFGVPVEVLGLLYYAAIGIAYALFIFNPDTKTEIVGLLALAGSALAFVFSVYLTFIQAVTIKDWCTWCITSAILTTLIFLAAVLGAPDQALGLLAAYEQPILLLHIIGFAIGLGAATVSDIFFFKFLRDLKINHLEADILQTLTQIIWFGLALIIISGTALFAPNAAEFIQSANFLSKMTVVLVIIVNGSLLNLIVAPKLIDISFGRQHEHKEGELHFERKLTFALGAISFVSWYSALGFAVIKPLPFTYGTMMTFYLGVLLVAVFVSQQIEQGLYKTKNTG